MNPTNKFKLSAVAERPRRSSSYATARTRIGCNCPRLASGCATCRRRSLVYIGSLNPQDGVDYLLRSLNHLLYDLKRDDFYCVIIGTGDSLEDLRSLAKN